MGKAFMVGVIAGGGYLLANNFVPSVKNTFADMAIDLVVAGVFGATAIHFLHKR